VDVRHTRKLLGMYGYACDSLNFYYHSIFSVSTPLKEGVHGARVLARSDRLTAGCDAN